MAAAGGLAHDLGHPPFGHAGEKQLDELSHGVSKPAPTNSGFEGNAQSFRIATRIEASYGESTGLRLTAGTRAAILKYPWGRGKSGLQEKKFGYYDQEQQSFKDAREWLTNTGIESNQQTLEASAMDLADDITYAVHDFEDFLVLGFMRPSTILFHCDGYTRRPRKERPNPIEDLAEELSADYPSRFDADLLRRACRELTSVPIPTPKSTPYSLRVWRNGNLDFFLSRLRITDEPHGDKGVRLDVDDVAWHRIELLKYFSKHYVIRRRETALLQRAGNMVLQNVISSMKEWIANNPDTSTLPQRYQWAQDWGKTLGSQTGRAYLDYLCMLSDTEVVHLSAFLMGHRIPKSLSPSF